MLKKLISWLFAREEELEVPVRVYDFTERCERGHDITLRVINDGDYAEAVIALTLGDLPPEVGDFVVVKLDGDSEPITFIIDTVDPVSLGISKLTLSRYEGAEDD